jgi:hypothetical protein
MIRRLLTTILLSSLAGAPANAAKVQSVIAKSAVTISIIGEFIEGDAEALKSAITRTIEGGYSIAEITLNSDGGSVFEGVNIVRLIHAANLNTNVALGATCASICFLAFAAGAKKSVNLAARIGVHVASDESGEETPASIAATAAMARIAQRLHVPPKVIESMVSTPPTKMFWLGKSDLEAMGSIITSDKQ